MHLGVLQLLRMSFLKVKFDVRAALTSLMLVTGAGLRNSWHAAAT
jgi:hypothetical protein